MKLHFKFPDGGEIAFDYTPMHKQKFRAVCSLFAEALYVALVWVVASQCGFWALLWLFLLTVIVLLIHSFCK